MLRVNCEFTASIVLARCHRNCIGRAYWDVSFSAAPEADIWVIARLDQDNRAPVDYYLLPRIDVCRSRICLADHNPVELDSYRFDNLQYFYRLASRASLRNVT